MTCVDQGVTKALEAVNISMGEAAKAGAAGSSGAALTVGRDIAAAGRATVKDLLAGYDRGLVRRAGSKEELQTEVRQSVEDFMREIHLLGQQPSMLRLQGEPYNELLQSMNADTRLGLLQDLEHHFSGYTSPPPQRFADRHPILKDALLVLVSVLLAKGVDLLPL